VGVSLIVVGLLAGLFFGYRWTQSLYYVGVNGSTVAIYQGVQQDLGPISLHSVYRQTSIEVASLPSYLRKTVEDTISASDLTDAENIIDRLSESK
jgi:hypothetical protein